MSSIQKVAVFDPRIVQRQPRYAVYQGALSNTNAPFNAISASSSQMTFNINCPSLNVFVDRAVEVSAGCKMKVDVAVPAGQPVQPQAPAVMTFGKDCALCAFPITACCNTLTASINDVTSSINVNDVLYEILRLVDLKRNRQERTCPTMLDKYQRYNDAVGASNNPLASYWDAVGQDQTPNGAWSRVVFCDRLGAELPVSAVVAQYTDANGVVIDYVNGIPLLTDTGAGVYKTNYQVYYKWRTTEHLVLSPFIFSPVHEESTGLFGINNIQLVMNFKQPSRVLRTASLASGSALARTFSGNDFLQADCWETPVVNVVFLTPSLALDLPVLSSVNYMEYPRYITSTSASIAGGASAEVNTQTIVLPVVPDLICVWCRPAEYQQGEGDFYASINSVSVNFDNFSGLLSSMTQEELYGMSSRNGVEMTYEQWRGEARVANPYPANLVGRDPQAVALTGSMLVMRPSQDIPLQSGVASGVLGQYTFQMKLNVTNRSSRAYAPQIYIMTINSGFFQTQSGSSRILKGVLTEQDVISAPKGMSADGLRRYVGGNFLSSLGNALTKVASNPAVQQLAKQGAQALLKKVGGATMGGATMGAGRKPNLSKLL